jgi:hypothetical protein
MKYCSERVFYLYVKLVFSNWYCQICVQNTNKIKMIKFDELWIECWDSDVNCNSDAQINFKVVLMILQSSTGHSTVQYWAQYWAPNILKIFFSKMSIKKYFILSEKYTINNLFIPFWSIYFILFYTILSFFWRRAKII